MDSGKSSMTIQRLQYSRPPGSQGAVEAPTVPTEKFGVGGWQAFTGG